MFRNYLSAFNILLLLSCNSPKEPTISADELLTQEASAAQLEETQENSDEEDPLNKAVKVNEVEPYLRVAKEMREKLIARLDKATPLEANTIYAEGGYRFDKTDEYSRLGELVQPVFARWVVYGNATEEDTLVIKRLADEGIVPFDIGEGCVDIHIEPFFYYNLFNDYVSPSTRDYLALISEQDVLISADAGLAVSRDLLYKWCIDWEKYLEKYPTTFYRKQIVDLYHEYINLLLFCTYDNTPVFDHNTHKINQNELDEIKALATQKQGRETDAIIAAYLKGLQKNNFTWTEQFEKEIMSTWILKDHNIQDNNY